MPTTQPNDSWRLLADYPISTGVAGPYVAACDGDLIVAGGSAFPDAPPWRGGTKVFYSEMFCLPDAASGKSAWKKLPLALPRTAGYGVTIVSGQRIILIGGCDSSHCYSDVIELTYRDHELAREVHTLPSLPVPLAFTTGAILNDKIFVAGGQTRIDGAYATSSFYSLDLHARDAMGWSWKEEKSWPGPPRVVALSTAVNGRFYLFSGRNVQPGKPTELLGDAYCYDATSQTWSTLPPIKLQPSDSPRCMMAGEAIADDQGRILLLGGDRGSIYMTLEELRGKIAAASGDAKKTLESQLNDILENHHGFDSDVIRFDPSRGTYENVGKLGVPAPVTTSAVRIGSSILLPVGEKRPGIRSPLVWMGSFPQ